MRIQSSIGEKTKKKKTKHFSESSGRFYNRDGVVFTATVKTSLRVTVCDESRSKFYFSKNNNQKQ